MSIESSKAVMKSYLTGDMSVVEQDATYTMMDTGEQWTGIDPISEMIHDFYHVAFDGRFKSTNIAYAPSQAVIEGRLMGRHIGEYAGVTATGKEVSVPMCIVYDLEDDMIVRARIYFLTNVFIRQVQDD